ncbi:hypothetical protein ACFFQW_40630 [Umezawaea endophytica]|uniref:Uncharacterized protein n=1 Tax=Umezawaea endophytica TaxID=1654476 RepID=A0A9X3AEC2_9PSEU|nr:hypothetical protein [Umezawaea endophytica]MCS7477107.1 hypothetical protein [Umezawaea endophytica]
MTEPNEGVAVDPHVQGWLHEERDAFQAYEMGDLTGAITGWTSLLEDEAALSTIRSEPSGDEALREVATELVTAHLRVGDDTAAKAVAAEWRVDLSGIDAPGADD